MSSPKPTSKEGLMQRAQRLLRPRKKEVPVELQQAINDCATMPQLLELLFSTDYVKDEAILDAFDKRMDQLDGSF